MFLFVIYMKFISNNDTPNDGYLFYVNLRIECKIMTFCQIKF